MDIHRIAYRVTFTYFRGSDIPLHEFDLYVRMVTALLQQENYADIVEILTGEKYTGTNIQETRREIAESIIETINYKSIRGSMVLDLSTINTEYTKTEYESGFLTNILGKKFVRYLGTFYTLEEYVRAKEIIKLFTQIGVVPRGEVQHIVHLKEQFQEMATWFNMYSEKQTDKFFLLLSEDIRRGDTLEVLFEKMRSKTIYGRINRDWVNYHESTANFEEKLTKVLEYAFEVHRLPKTVQLLYIELKYINDYLKELDLTLPTLQEQGYLTNITIDDIYPVAYQSTLKE